jgi:hypothetical protein
MGRQINRIDHNATVHDIAAMQAIGNNHIKKTR